MSTKVLDHRRGLIDRSIAGIFIFKFIRPLDTLGWFGLANGTLSIWAVAWAKDAEASSLLGSVISSIGFEGRAKRQ